MANIIYSEDGKTLIRARNIVGHFTVPNSVIEIADRAFSDCTGLTAIEIPNSVIEIGSEAFSHCAGLTSVEIPDSVTKIRISTFKGCTALTAIEIPNSVTEIGDRAFNGCSALASVEIPNSITEIGGWAFSGCESLTSIEIPDSVTKIGMWAFSDCSALNVPLFNANVFAFMPTNYEGTYSILPGVKAIASCAFYGCTGLTFVKIPNSITEIGYKVFEGCSSLTAIEFPQTITSIGECALSDCTSMISVDIPNSVTEIGENAFYGCTGLTSVKIPNSVVEIGMFAFSSCKNIEFEVSPTNTKYKSQRGSLYSENGKTLVRASLDEDGCFAVPDGVETLDFGCFSGLEIDELYIPASVKEINPFAFEESRIQKLHLSHELPECDKEIFEGAFWDSYENFCEFMKDCTLYVPIGTGYAFRHHPIFSQFKEVIIEK